MANAISASGSAALTITASIPTYNANGMTGSGSTRTLTFSAGAPPTDGSVGLAYVTLDPSLAQEWQGGGSQRLLYFRGGSNSATIIPNPPDGSELSASVPDWYFI